MAQNLVTLDLTDAQLAGALAALQQLEAALPGLIVPPSLEMAAARADLEA